jgi:hypothetical protein
MPFVNGDGMNLLIWLDAPLITLGVLAMSPWLWNAFRSHRTVFSTALSRDMRTTTALLFYLGIATVASASVDAGLAEWGQAHRSGDNVEIRETMMAPDFSLPSLDEARTVRLSDYRGHKPVVLIFGNFY